MSSIEPKTNTKYRADQVDPGRGGRTPAVGYQEIAEKADHYLQRVKQEAASIVAAARRHAEEVLADAESQRMKKEVETFDEARRAGYREGKEQALIEVEELRTKLIDENEQQVKAEAKRQIHDRIETLLPVLRHAAGRIDADREQWAKYWETAALDLVRAVAEKIIHREISHDHSILFDFVRDALRLAAQSPWVRIHLSEPDSANLQDDIEQLARDMSISGNVEIIGSRDIEPGGCLVETPSGIIDQQIRSQLDRLFAEISD